MTKKSSESREKTRSDTRAEFERRAGKLLAGNIIVLAAMMLVFDDDEDGSEPSE